ncbi:DUF2891 domain-containing protein [Flavobacterium sp. MAH-1]|uniref:DUF2891 domain-containing protein n=1 Tax=Flavobacterium agri TaxID=2743471 RepID=A0A7Y8Y1N3_9FLAO|nr:DUF2891 domain-containing protein [Flavobacterium agri]NUY80922.1 DUF2891 domain-containing protein [Flavobacterium agri]NYA70946.1 DUF2891 domain-containing protein [Flavobacterium agri]
MKRLLLLFLIVQSAFAQQLTLEQANHLATLPLKCLQQEYPNKPGESLSSASEIMSPKQAHPAFYGCYDWHSSVHGHWSLVYLLNRFPQLANRDEVISKLKTNLSKENIEAEIAYLNRPQEKSFERTYGWNWLFKLQLELDQSKESYAKELSSNLLPLTNVFIERYIAFLPKLLYPVRVGTHNNTAFGLTFAWDYAVFTKNEAFQKSIRENAVRFFGKDTNYPYQLEPSGTDFLSPCLEEIGIMQRVLPKKEFLKWAHAFFPSLSKKNFDWEVGKVADASDPQLVHLYGLNFSRAWNLYRLIKQYPGEFSHLKSLADKHLLYSLPKVVDGNYEGEHWLASFAFHAFEEK